MFELVNANFFNLSHKYSFEQPTRLLTAKSAKNAKFFYFLRALSELGGSRIYSFGLTFNFDEIRVQKPSPKD